MSLLENIAKGYNFLFVELADPRVKSWFLMSSPASVLGVIGCYLYFVFKLGPKLMKDRPAFNLDKLLVVYNLIQILACSYLIVQYVRYLLPNYNPFCEPVDYSEGEIPMFVARHVWLYFILKCTDLLDTVFFILRKKNSQVSFLHVYHHTGMCVLSWGGVKYLAGGHGVFVGFLNSIVHVVMYCYYLLSAWDKEYKKSVWWKKHITQLQITQFCILALYFIQLLFQPNCGYPRWTALFFVPQNIFMITLFMDFYIKNYIKPQATKNNQKFKSNSNSTNVSEECKKKSE